MRYDWSGSRILQEHTSIPSKRCVIGHEDTLVPTDLREWVSVGDHEEIRRVIRALALPRERDPGTFDRRAELVWQYVVTSTKYVQDPESHRRGDFWQFPAETIALRQGDCEDTSFLLATLLLAAEISPFCVRVVFGSVIRAPSGGGEQHAWVIYKDEAGTWQVLESTLCQWPAAWVPADDAVKTGASPRYLPDICLNGHHVWQVRRKEIGNVAAYIRGRKRTPKQAPEETMR